MGGRRGLARARAPERTFPKRARHEGAWPLRWQARARQAALEPQWVVSGLISVPRCPWRASSRAGGERGAPGHTKARRGICCRQSPAPPPYIRPVHGACACRARAVHCAQRSALADAVSSEGLARLSVRCDVVQRPELRSEPRLAPRCARAAGCAAGVLGAAAPCGADSFTIRERIRVGAGGGDGEN